MLPIMKVNPENSLAFRWRFELRRAPFSASLSLSVEWRKGRDWRYALSSMRSSVQTSSSNPGDSI